MFRVALSPKHESQLRGVNENKNCLTIPEHWEDFARLCDINSEGLIQKFNPYPYQLEIEKLSRNHSIVAIKGRFVV